jgi:DNA primase catalytic core
LTGFSIEEAREMLYTQAEIEAVKRSVDLVALIRSSGVELKKKGKDFVGLCPFHDDKSPSLLVSAEKGLWNCLGACKGNGHPSGGDALGWLVRYKHLSFPEAMKELGAPPPAAQEEEKPSPPSSELLETVVAHYHESLLSSKEAKSYLEKRKLWSPDLIKAFRLGFADGSLVERLGRSPLKKDLRALGVLTGSGRELMKGCIVVPILQGPSVVNLYGRKVEGTQHLYLPGPRHGLFNASGAKDASRLVLCESIFDALSLLILGEPGALPLWGVHGWTEDHEAFLKTWRGKDLVLALDSDEAGKGAASALAVSLALYNPRVLDLGEDKDPNELLSKEEDPKATWARLVAPRPVAVQDAPKEKEGGYQEEEKSPLPPFEKGGILEGDSLSFSFDGRRYTVKGLTTYGLDRLKVTVSLEAGAGLHLDTLDLYSARARDHFAEGAKKFLGTEPVKVCQDLTAMVGKLETMRLQMKAKGKEPEGAAAMGPEEREEALALLKDPRLLDRVLDDFEKLGCVGEREALGIGYLATISRLLDKPLGMMILARSGAGKTTVQDAVCDFVPEESLVKYTRITGQALFYKDENALVNKVLALEEAGGAESADYSIRNLQSSQTLTIGATRTDPQTGKHTTDSYTVRGPVAIMLTTTDPKALNDETRNRFLVATVDESHEQTARILKAQREEDTLQGLLRQARRDKLMRLHQNAQRLLRTLKVLNPFAEDLIYPVRGLKSRREQKKYLTLLKAVALLHQHQRPVKTASQDGVSIEYVEISQADLDHVDRIARDALKRGLDELSPAGRRLYQSIKALVASKKEAVTSNLPPGMMPPEATVCRKEIRQAMGWSDWQLRTHLSELQGLEYIAQLSSGLGRRAQFGLYEDEDEGEPELLSTRKGEPEEDDGGKPREPRGN